MGGLNNLQMSQNFFCDVFMIFLHGKKSPSSKLKKSGNMTHPSRRITLRNRRFLRKIDPICRKSNVALPAIPHVHISEEHPNTKISSRVDNRIPLPPPIREKIADDLRTAPDDEQEDPENQDFLPRRSRRKPVPRQMFSAKLRGKSHDSWSF